MTPEEIYASWSPEQKQQFQSSIADWYKERPGQLHKDRVASGITPPPVTGDVPQVQWSPQDPNNEFYTQQFQNLRQGQADRTFGQQQAQLARVNPAPSTTTPFDWTQLGVQPASVYESGYASPVPALDDWLGGNKPLDPGAESAAPTFNWDWGVL